MKAQSQIEFMRLFGPSLAKAFATLFLASLCTACDGYGQKKLEPQSNRRAANQASKGFAVIELFTSEGCSSCPPADALLPKLKQEYGDRVFILSFHVDYWNRLGWKDPFSSAEFTRRQNQYASAFKSENVYTPQAVVNGKIHLTGTSRIGLKKLIDAELASVRGRTISVSVSKDGAKALSVSYEAALQSGEVVNIALVQLSAATAVRAGENTGRQLQHSSVVRDFKTYNDKTGTVRFELPGGLPPRSFSVIAYTQRRDMHITGVTQTDIE